ncbi:cytochrome P450 [Streptomyces sp. NBC_00882]|uniref:cytochrome P450 n=1 Tax=Streptomyces sp. NBC_00882 TaxID=2975856 RepID=UPI003870DC6F|nr:cytochrome P450 [Streptomyces sp. NBC_00882]
MTEKLPLKPLPAPAVMPIMVGRFLSGPRYMERHFARHGALVPDWAPGARAVWLRDPRLIEQVLHSSGVEHNTTGRLMGRVMGSTAMLNQLSGEAHHAVSRLMIPTLRGDALSGNRAAIAVAAQRMANACPAGTPFRLLPLLDTAVAEANVRACLSVDDPRLLHTWVKAIARLRQTTVRPAVMAYAVGMLPWWPTGHRAWSACLHLVREEVAGRRRTGTIHHDVLGILLASGSEELSDEVLCDQIVFYLLAAQAPALAAAWVIERATRTPHVWHRLVDEASGHDDSAPYTDAVIREALRLRPPVTAIPWLLREPCDIGGYDVPAGTFAVASLWDLHRNPDLYPDPEGFRPERFLGNRPPRGAWLPFGSGPHACIGGQLAFIQVTVLVHTLVRRGQLLPATRQDEGIGHRASTEIYPAEGCRVTLRPVRGRHPQGAR